MQTFINKTETPKILSILICSMGKRKKMLDRLLTILKYQVNEYVEIVIDTDDGELTIGQKRNALLESSSGEYVAFVDDDDVVSDDYVEKILKAVENKPDSCAFEALITTNGQLPKPVYYSMKYEKWVDTAEAHYRSPQHLSPIKREIAVKVKYPDTSFYEDRVYSEGIFPLIKSESVITGIIYYYDYIPNKSWFKSLIPTDTFYHIDIMAKEVYGTRESFNNVLLGIGVQFLPTLKEVFGKYPTLKPIGYQFEQLYHGSKHVNDRLSEWVYRASDFWDYDLDNISYIANTFGKSPKFRPLVYAESLKVLKNKENPEIDVLFYGHGSERRKAIIDMIKGQNPTKNIQSVTAWGNKLDPYLENSKIVLNLHYYETCLQEQARMFYPLINGKCVLSEISTKNYYSDIIMEAPTEHIGRAVTYLLEKDRWRTYANNASNDFKTWSKDVMNRMILD